jgi:serine/threonine-protein kinase
MTDPDAVTRLSAALEGRYRVERELGEGGMATVYLATDLRHERKVALKVLKPELAAIVGADRFLAEIKTTANLQHPHILPLFDSGEAGSFLFYAMPYVEGETLAERLDREHQLPVDEAIRTAGDIAEALDYAHRRGVIHRDIKPANLLLHDGKPVISDFGIALAVGAAGGGRLTETGLSLGTPHYMSPEQATGDQHLGPATDVYALGCVLYEMLVGEPPFTGSTPQAVLGKIITGELPSASEQRKSVPENVDATIRRALEKLPADRFRSAADLAKALADRGFRHGVESSETSGVGHRGLWNPLSVAMTVLAGLLALGLGWARSSSVRTEPRVVSRFDVTPRENARLVPGVMGVDIAVSSDGSRIVYVGVGPGGGTQLWQRSLTELEATPIPGTTSAFAPALSPDGLSVAFQVAGALRVVPLTGGPSVTVVASGVAGFSTAWASDGMIYLGLIGRGVHRVAAAGGEPEIVTAPSGRIHAMPHPLPDGRGLLLTVIGSFPAQSRVAVVGPDGGEAREILTGTMARYAATGHVVYTTSDGTLMAAPFDTRRLEVTGPPMALVAGVRVSPSSASQFALSASGTLLYESAGVSDAELVWVDRSGQVDPVDSEWKGDFSSPALSPDAARLAVTIREGASSHVWVKSLGGAGLKLTLEGGVNDYPSWTADGGSVTFFSDVAAPPFKLWTKRADGSRPAELQLEQERPLAESLWSPDGEWLVFRTDRGAPGGGDIMALRPGVDTAPVEVVATASSEIGPALSPDGHWMAYTADETGRYEVYVVPFPRVDAAKWLISTAGGSEALWARGGGEIFYRNGLGEMVAVRVDTGSVFSPGPTRVLFPATAYRANPNHREYGVAPQGDRFLMVRSLAGDGSASLVLVQNFSDELTGRAGR